MLALGQGNMGQTMPPKMNGFPALKSTKTAVGHRLSDIDGMDRRIYFTGQSSKGEKDMYGDGFIIVVS